MKTKGIIVLLLSVLLIMLCGCKEPEEEKEVVLDAPVITSISAVSSTQVSLSWTSVKDANSYTVKWYTNFDGVWMSDIYDEKETTLTSATINSLIPNTEYAFYVYARNGSSKSESKGMKVKTKAK